MRRAVVIAALILAPAIAQADEDMDKARSLADPSPGAAGPIEPAPGQSAGTALPCECAIRQGACTASLELTPEGHRATSTGTDIAYVLGVNSSDKRCSRVGYTLQVTSRGGAVESHRYEAIVANGRYAAGGLLSTTLGADAKIATVGATCFVCGE